MVTCGISCHIRSNCRTRSLTFRARCNHLPIISQTCSIGERSGYLAGQGRVWQACRQFIATRAICGLALSCWKTSPEHCKRDGNKTSLRMVVDVPLCSKSTSNDDQRVPAVKGNDTPDHNALRVGVACNSESRISPLPCGSPNTSLMIVRTELEVEFVAKDYASPVGIIPTWSSCLYVCWMRSSDALEIKLFIHRTPNFNHLHICSKHSCIRNFKAIEWLLLGASIFLL